MATEGSTDGTDSTADTASTGADKQTKDAFLAALERKRTKNHPHEDASQGDGKAHDAHSAAGGKRMHRRKSG